ncbi:hypothetical protein DAPPUDRAFT_343447 [Daphnia pulex]|uniref:Dynein heavy chain hydrolytic ATP-binding dynein motor region domain-containing protein n=1 Tax=Daphnia pulex TaxID=6669 RepID=E9I6R6_DAPPU|nr:hypothetical protein DAPPUDRAFT_343447 [Daphnia pulex]|eukprot:EFX60314.1 hypothetical protein DAPPUDRAFT_343447 [Daphnia pulex]
MRALEMMKASSRSVGYENHFFLCSKNTTVDAMNNVCKAITQTGFWVTCLNLNNLSVKSMSTLSNFLGQINERKETVIINNDQYKLNLDAAKQRSFAYFATTKSNNQLLVDVKNDSLKITRIYHYLNLISKDLLDKFRIVIAKSPDLKNFINANLVANGFTTNEQLASQIYKLIEIYQRVLKVPMKSNGN